MGAWIETELGRFINRVGGVAPYMGAWIETRKILHPRYGQTVAPYMGAWIETCRGTWRPADR